MAFERSSEEIDGMLSQLADSIRSQHGANMEVDKEAREAAIISECEAMSEEEAIAYMEQARG